MQIIGLFLVKNEDLNIEWCIKNALDFCDKIIVCDNYSTDSTWDKIKKLEQSHEKIVAHRVSHPRDSHKFIEQFAGTETWVIAVDGDEIYDKHALSRLKNELLAGTYQQYFKLVGHSFHVLKLDTKEGIAEGYSTPVCKSVTKLYNFNAVTVWKNPPHERLHGGEIQFRNGYNDNLRLNFTSTMSWEECNLKCLHLCFVPRSSSDEKVQGKARINVDENPNTYASGFISKIKSYLGLQSIPLGESKWKIENYAKGEIITRNLDSFLSEQ